MSFSISKHFSLPAIASVAFIALLSGSATAGVSDVCTESELSAAISRASPGDSIVMCDRTWDNTKIVFDADGEDGAPITLTTQSPGGVILTGSSTLKLGGSFLVVDGLRFEGPSSVSDNVIDFELGSNNWCNDCRVTNITMIDYNPSDPSDKTNWVHLKGERNRVDHSHFKGKANIGSVIQLKRDSDTSAPNFHRIDHNLIEDRPETDAYGSNGDTLEVGSRGSYSWSDSKSVVEFNYLRNIFSDYEALTVKSSGNTIRYNVIEGSRGVLSLRQGHRNLVQGNFILGRGERQSGGIRIQGTDHIIVSNYVADVNPNDDRPFAGIRLAGGSDELRDDSGDGKQPYRFKEEAAGVLVAHNTIVNSGGSIVFGSGDVYAPRDNELISNVVYRGQGKAIDPWEMGENNSFSSNYVSAESIGISDPGVRNVDSKLVPDEFGIERPTATSPVMDAAPDINLLLADMDGQARNGARDIGADEVVSATMSRGPVPLCAVGPTTYRVGLPPVCSASAWNEIRPMPPQLLAVE